MTTLERPAVNTKEPAPVIPPKQINSVVVDLNGRRQAFVTIEDAGAVILCVIRAACR